MEEATRTDEEVGNGVARTGTGGSESYVLKVSVRAWLSLLLCVTVCFMSACGMKVTEPLYSAMLLALGFYFGQKGRSSI